MAGLRHAQQSARGYLAQGGAASDPGFAAARALHRDFVARRRVTGGAADTLAAACWMRRVCERL